MHHTVDSSQAKIRLELTPHSNQTSRWSSCYKSARHCQPTK